MNNEQKLLIDLLRMEFCDCSDIKLPQLDDDILEKLLSFAAYHSVAPIISETLFNRHLLDDSKLKEYYKQILLKSVFRYEMQNGQQIKVCRLFEENEICHIALKGAVLRNFYPEPWLRTSCDIDILIYPEDLERAIEVLKNNGYLYKGKGSHDASFYSDDNVHVELHYDVIEKEYRVADVSDVLCDIWQYASPKPNFKYEYVLTDEMFYFYHIAHMAKHFVQGGCGIRAFLDLWIIDRNMHFDSEKRSELLVKGGLRVFADNAHKLADVWFLGGEHTDITEKMQSYIFNGGIYGNLENQIAMDQAKTDSKTESALKKIFLGYDTIKFHYPILQKHKWLLPFMEVRRWGKLMFIRKHRERSVNHLLVNKSISKDQKTEAEELRTYLGL